MTAILRVVLDQAVAPTDPDLERATIELARALVDTTPAGTAVAGIAPAGDDPSAHIPGLVDVWRAPLGRAKLAASWQLGVAPGVGGGMIHAPTLLAPLIRHDRAHDHDQTVVTLWSLDPWLAPDALPRAHVAAQKALLKRAVKHADAIVVPTHALADELSGIARFSDRVRVIPGAAPAGFAVPTDAGARRRDLALPDAYVVVGAASGGLLDAFRAIAAHPSLHAVVLDVSEGAEPGVVEAASAAGIPERHVHVVDVSDAGDRAALLDGALAFVAAGSSTAFPWRLLDALAVGAPVIASATPSHVELLADGGQLVAVDGHEPIVGALGRVLGDETLAARMRVLATDRSRAFSWRDSAERVWALHADL